MPDPHLDFQVLESRTVFSTPIFDLVESRRLSPAGKEGRFVLIEPPAWANVIAVTADDQGRDCFLMVRQFRHGLSRSVWEFPGGMVEPGEDPAAAAARELEEETGWKAQGLTLLGSVNPNPAFMTNRVWTFSAPRVVSTGVQGLDENEFVSVGLRPVEVVLAGMGEGEYDHGIMLMALWFWMKRYGEKR